LRASTPRERTAARATEARGLDADARIVSLLAEDGRRSNRDIARITGIAERQVAARIRRLLDGDRLRIVAVVDVFGAGFEFMLSIGIEVSGRPPADVATQLANMPEVLSVVLMSGEYDIEIVLVARDQEALARFVQDRLGRVAGIRRLAPALRLEVFKFQSGLGPIVAGHGGALDFPEGSPLDALEIGVLRQLWIDPRATNQAIAKKLRTSESTVRTRIADLRARGVLRITAIGELPLDRGRLLAFVGVELDGRSRAAVARELTRMGEVRFVSAVLGRFDLLAIVLAENASELSRLVHDRIAALAGVRTVRTAHALQFAKYDYRWASIRATPQGRPSPPLASSTAPLTADA
jgi:DNA-binding Lrp family transcriptional regulator